MEIFMKIHKQLLLMKEWKMNLSKRLNIGQMYWFNFMDGGDFFFGWAADKIWE